MKQTVLLTTLLMFLLISTTSVMASDDAKETKEATPVLTNQTLCPVMGGAIDSLSFTDIQGQRVYHCCPMCSAKLKADPNKYFKEAAAKNILFENIQTTCPISGEKLEDKSIYSDFEGRRIYMCCKKCVATFVKDPQKVLDTMDSMKDKMEMKMDSVEDHSGHNH